MSLALYTVLCRRSFSRNGYNASGNGDNRPNNPYSGRPTLDGRM